MLKTKKEEISLRDHDQVMHLGWSKLLPLALVNLIVYLLIVTVIDQNAAANL